MLCCFLVYLGMLVLLESTSFHLESLPSGPMIFKYVFFIHKICDFSLQVHVSWNSTLSGPSVIAEASAVSQGNSGSTASRSSLVSSENQEGKNCKL